MWNWRKSKPAQGHPERAGLYVRQAKAYLEKNYRDPASPESSRPAAATLPKSYDSAIQYSARGSVDSYNIVRVANVMKGAQGYYAAHTLSEELDASLNQSFVSKLNELIREKGMSDPEVYKAAQIDRRLFSKIRSNFDFKPSKDTVLSLIFALNLSLPQATDLLNRAGYALSHSIKRDVIIEYFITEGISNLTDINLALGNLGQKIIGRA